MKNTKSQTIYLTTGRESQIIVRGIGLTEGQAKEYAREYLDTTTIQARQISGKEALVHSILAETKTLDIDENYIL